MPTGNTNIHKHINVSELINISVSFAFCELKRVTRWNEGKLSFKYDHDF